MKLDELFSRLVDVDKPERNALSVDKAPDALGGRRKTHGGQRGRPRSYKITPEPEPKKREDPSKGGRSRAEKLAPERRSEIARMGGIAARGKSGRPRTKTPEQRKEEAMLRTRRWREAKKAGQS